MTQLSIQRAIALGIQHQRAGRIGEAENVYRQILAQQPNHPEALHLLGLTLSQNGELEAGLEFMRRAIAAGPSAAHYHCNLASVLAGAGRFEEAIRASRRALELRPNYPQAMNNLGSALDSSGQSDEAIAVLEQALALAPNSVAAHNNLGNALRKKGRIAEALAAFRRALQLRPGEAQTLNNYGSALRANDQIDEAIGAFEQAIASRPDYAEAHNNLGNALRDKGLTDRAIAEFHRALNRPNLPHAHNNLAGALEELGHNQQAIDAYRQSIRIRPDHFLAHVNMGIALLRQGDCREGWPEYEWRCRNPELTQVLGELKSGRWDGGELAGRRILLQSEQGFGDTIQAARYVPLVAQRGGRIVLRCQPELMRLMRSLDGIEEIVPASDPPPPHDVHCPLMSLPMLFGTTVETIPNKVPYLRADEELVAYWRKRVGAIDARLKVGLVWSGRPEFPTNERRSLRLSALAALAQVEGIHFFSLQKGPAAEQVRQVQGMPLTDWNADLHDFADSAALLQNLDLFITTDTAPAHLAGAVGARVWLLLSFVPDWRWLFDRTDSPWYPTLRLFRQPKIGDWETPVQQVAEALRER